MLKPFVCANLNKQNHFDLIGFVYMIVNIAVRLIIRTICNTAK